MATEIDQKVVQMTFDNSRFEKNAQTTIKTLEQLNSKSSFQGMQKGLKEVNAAARNVDLSPLTNSAKAVQVEFTKLGTVTDEIFRQITRGALNAGKQLVSSMSVDQVTAGFSKYEDKLTSVRTIMNSTGMSVEEVNKELERLNWFTDETSYNFVDMVNNIGKFTNNKVPLDQAVTAMQGIANWAALSGQGINEASRAMYNISQAIGSGFMRYEDWKSIENANMHTIEFRQNVIDAAVAMGTLVKRGDKYFTTVKNTEVSAVKFIDALTTEKWFTKDVLLNVLDQYGSFANEVYEIYSNTDMLTSDIIENLKSMPGFMETVGSRAFAAAQEYRTLGDAINATKDAVSTGWMQTFEIIIGNTEEAKEIWTAFGDAIWEIFASGIEARNEMFKAWKKQDGRSILISGIGQAYENLLAVIEPVNAAIQNMFPPMTVERLLEMTKAFANFTSQFKMSEDAAKSLNTIVRALLLPVKALTIVLKIAGTTLGGVVILAFRLVDAMLALAQNGRLLSTVLTAIFGQERYEKLMTAVNTLVEKLSPGLEAIKQKILDLTGSTDMFGAIGNALGKVADAAGNLIDLGLDGIVGFFEALARLDFTDLKSFGSSILREINNGLKTLVRTIGKFGVNIVEGIGEGITDAFPKIVSSIKDLAFTIVNTFASLMGIHSPSTVMARQGEYLMEGLAQGINSSNDPEQAMNSLSDKFENSVTTITGRVSSAITEMNPILAAGSAVVNGTSLAVNGVSESIENLGDSTQKSGSGIVKFLYNVTNAMGEFIAKLTPGRIIILAFGVALVQLTSNLATFFDQFSGVFGAFRSVMNNFSKMFQQQGSTLHQFAVLILAITASLAVLTALDTDKLMTAVTVMVSAMLGITIVIAALAGLQKLLKTDDAIKNLATSISIMASSLLMVATSIAILTGAIVALTALPLSSVAISLLEIGAALVILGGAVAFIARRIPPDVTLKAAGLMLALAGSIILLVYAINTISNENLSGAASNIVLLIPIVAAMTIIGVMARGIKAGSALGLIGFCLSLNVVARILTGLDSVTLNDITRNLNKLMILFPILTGLAIIARVFGQNASKAGIFLVSIGATMWIISHVIDIIGTYDEQTIKKGVGALSVLLIAFGLLARLSIMGENDSVAKLGTSALYIAGAIGVLSVVISGLGAMDTQAIIKGTGAVALLMTLFGVVAALAKRSKDQKGGMGSIIAVALSVAVLSGVVAVLSLIPGEEAITSVSALIILMTSFGILFRAITTSVNWKDALLSVLSMGVLVGAFVALGLKLKEVKAGELVALVTGLTLAVRAMIMCYKALGDVKNVDTATIGKFVIAITFAAAGLSGAFKIMKGLDGLTVVEQAAGLTLAVLGLTVMYNTLANASKLTTTEKRVDNFLESAIKIIGGLGIAFSVMAHFKVNGAQAMGQAAALTVAALGLAAMFNVFNSVKAQRTDRMQNFVLAAVVAVGLMTTFFAVLADVDGKNMVVQATALALGANALAVAANGMVLAMAAMNAIPKSNGDIMGKIVAFVAITGLMASVIGLFEYFNVGSNPAQLMTSISAMVILANGMSAALVVLNLLPDASVISGMLPKLGMLGALTIGCGLVVAGLASFASQTDNATLLTQIASIVILANGMSAALLILAQLPVASLPGMIAGLGKFMVLIGALALVVVALGALTHVEGFNELVTSGIVVFGQLGLALGSFIGNVIGGIVGGIGGGFVGGAAVGLATSLSLFSEAIQPFVANVQSIDQNVVDSVLKLAQVFLIICGAELLDALTFWVGARTTWEEFGQGLEAFTPYFVDFAEAMGGIDGANLEACSNAALALAQMSNVFPREGGLIGMIMGNAIDLGLIGNQLALFGPGFVTFANTIGQVDKENIEKSVEAGKAFASLVEALPREGGWLQSIIGNPGNMVTFSSGIVAFGTALVQYSSVVSKEGAIDKDAIDESVQAAGGLVELENKLRGHEGMFQTLFGDANLDTFASSLESFGTGLVNYSAAISGELDYGAIMLSAQAAKGLVELDSNLKNHGGMFKDLFGDNDLGVFGEKLVAFGSGLKSYSDAISANGGLDKQKVDDSVAATKKLVELEGILGTDGGIFEIFSDKVGFEDFGAGIKAFGKGLAAYGEGIEKINIDKAKEIDNIVEDLVYISGKVDQFDADSMTIFSEALSEVVTAAIDSIANSNMGDEASLLLNNFSSALLARKGSFSASLTNFYDALYVPLTDLEIARIKIETFMNGLGLQFKLNDKPIADAGVALMTTFYNSFGLSEFDESSTMHELVEGIKSELLSNLGVRNESSAVFEIIGETIAKGIQNGIVHSQDSLKDEMIDSVKIMKNTFIENADIVHGYSRVFERYGRYIIAGLVSGITGDAPDSTRTIRDLADSIASVFAKRLGIQSPSVVMKEQGHYIVQGIAEGITEDTSAEEAISKKAQNIAAAFETEINKIDITDTTADLELQLWKALNPNASDAEIAQKESELLDIQLRSQAERVALANAEYQANLQEFGANTVETQEAYNKFLQEQIDMADLASRLLSNREEKTVDQAEAFRNYAELMTSQYDFLRKSGFEDAEIKEYFMQQTGFRPQAAAEDSMKDVASIVQSYMKDVSVEIDHTIVQSAKTGVSGMGSAAVDAAEKELDKTDPSDFVEYFNQLYGDSVDNVDIGGIIFGDSWMGKVVTGAASHLDEFGDLAINGVNTVMGGALDRLNKVIAPELNDAGAEAGYQTANGYATGMDNSSDLVNNAAENMASGSMARTRQVLQVQSPSKVFAKIGNFVALGFAEGIRDGESEAINAAIEMAVKAINAAQQALNSNMGTNSTKGNTFFGKMLDVMPNETPEWKEKMAKEQAIIMAAMTDSVSQAMRSENDFEPTIRPVMDLSEIEEGMRTIDNYMGRRQAVEVQATRTKSKQRRQEIQNGSDKPQDKQIGSAPIYNFTQNNYSPKALSKSEIYRQTRNQFSQLKERVNPSK